MSTLITPTRTPSYAKTPKRDLLPLRKEDFSGFSPEPFLRVITTATAITTIATLIIIIITITTTAIGGLPIRVKIFPFKKTFRK